MIERNKLIQEAVTNIVIPEYPDLRLSVSFGGVCNVHPIREAIRQADERMYQNKNKTKFEEKRK